MTAQYLRPSRLLNFESGSMQALVERRRWAELAEYDRISAVYTYIRDEIPFGYNADDALPASRVLADGFGQCNTKAILFMALLRAVGIPCRIHGFTIDKALQRGAMTGLVYHLAPREIVHSWVEVLYAGCWLELEGFILDRPYLAALQARNLNCSGAFCGYGVATENFRDPPVDWRGGNTYIQSAGIVRDLGVYAMPDRFFAMYRQQLSPIRGFLYRHWGRHRMNRNIAAIRGGQIS